METDLGKTTVDLGLSFPMGFVRAAYGNMVKYQPAVGTDTDRNRYLFWIVDEREGYVPAWDADEQEDGKPPLVDRAEVLKAWKLVEAREPARKRAEELAEQARKSGKPLTELSFDNQPGKALAPFSWMTAGNMFMPAQQSTVDGVEHAGEEFMQTVFDLKPGELGVAFDDPQSTVYVIRLTSATVGFGSRPPEDSMVRSLFMTSSYNQYQQVADADYAEIYQDWIRRVSEDVDLEWKREPDSRE